MQIVPRFTGPAFIGTNPEINWVDPITQNLKGCWLPGVVQWNLVDAAFLQLTDTGNTPRAGIYGGDYFFSGANLSGGFKSLGPPYLSNSGGTQFSIFALAAVNSGSPVGAVNGGAFYCERASSGNDIIKLGYSSGSLSVDTIQFTLRDDTGTLLQQSDTISPRDNIYRTWLLTKNGNGGSGNAIMYRNGVVASTANWTGTDSYTNAGLTGTIGYDIADNSGNTFAHVALVAVWPRVLSPVEARRLASDPFCFLLFNEDYVAATLVGKAPVSTVHFRRTLSSIGTRTGSRQGVMQ